MHPEHTTLFAEPSPAGWYVVDDRNPIRRGIGAGFFATKKEAVAAIRAMDKSRRSDDA